MKNRMMLVFAGATLVAVSAYVFAQAGGAKDEAKVEAKPKYTIEEVMVRAHKEKLMNKVVDGKADREQKQKLLDLYLALWENKPPQGDILVWKEKSGDVIVAAAKVVLGEAGAEAQLKAAADCRGCHNIFKPRKQR